ncbi:hypothetical protein Fcan01_11890 [Folsomia candida]|uniref:Uncharacterized protein n=1 Tax=Folsomia candida TaxID=158441 RepID=A0A226E840_FOLCA|nr:hypothetical protein Fcan01_11890 [Folsomia candida]
MAQIVASGLISLGALLVEVGAFVANLEKQRDDLTRRMEAIDENIETIRARLGTEKGNDKLEDKIYREEAKSQNIADKIVTLDETITKMQIEVANQEVCYLGYTWIYGHYDAPAEEKDIQIMTAKLNATLKKIHHLCTNPFYPGDRIFPPRDWPIIAEWILQRIRRSPRNRWTLLCHDAAFL